MAIPRVKVVNPYESWLGTEYFIDGNKVKMYEALIFELQLTKLLNSHLKHLDYRKLILPETFNSASRRKQFNSLRLF